MGPQLSPDPYRCDCHLPPEDGTTCGIHPDGRYDYYPPERRMPWD